MPYPVRIALTAAIAIVFLSLSTDPGVVSAQTAPATTGDAAADDLPPPISRRTGDDDAAGPPPVTPENDGPPPVRDDDPPPAPPAMAYYLVIDGQRQGPLDETALVTLVKDGKLTPSTKVWTKGMADWTEAAGVAEIAELIKTHAPPPPPPPQAAFYIAEAGQRTGPFTLDQIKGKIAKGEFTARTQVWKSGMASWAPAGDVPELASLLKAAPAPAPKDAVSFIAGRWELGPIQVPVEGAGQGDFKSTLELLGNGQYRITAVLEYRFGEVPMRRVTNGTGTYTAKYKSADKITIVAKGQSTTTLTNASNGRSNKPAVEAVDFSFDFTVIDRNSLDDGSAQPWRRVAQ